MKLFAALVLVVIATLSMPALAQTPAHLTLESGRAAFNFPAAQDSAVNHFEICIAATACVATSGFSALTVTSKAADSANPGMNLYTALLPPATPINTTLVAVMRACAAAGTGASCSGVSAASGPFVLDLSAPSNLRVQ